MWLYFELPIAFINAASIVMFFEWTQFANFMRAAIKSQVSPANPDFQKSFAMKGNVGSDNHFFVDGTHNLSES